MKNRAYRATAVKSVELEQVLQGRGGQAATVGVDIGKGEIFVVVRWADEAFERPWKVKNPSEVRLLVGLLEGLGGGRVMRVGMESSGTYGDALRQALTDAKLDVRRVSGKAVHDYAEIFDGVPSQHDGKDAAIVAELVALGKSCPWPYQTPTAADGEMAYWVQWLDAQQRIETMWLGRLESLVARFWPEVTGLLKLTSKTLLRCLLECGGPGELAKAEGRAKRLSQWSRGSLSGEKIQALLESAATTVGIRPSTHDVPWVQQCAKMALAAHREVHKARKELMRLGRGNPILVRQAEAVGLPTACVLRVAVGDPRDYPCGEAYRKAMGLNLRERSSGKHEGKLKITKRGSAVARRWLYFAAMRQCQKPGVRGWYQAKKARDKDRGEGALIGIARKLAMALHRVGVHEEAFEAWRLFPGHLNLKGHDAGGLATAEGQTQPAAGGQPPDPRDLSQSANPGEQKQSGATPVVAPSPVLAPGRRSGRVPAEPYPPSSPKKHSTKKPHKEPKK